jgi:CBS-domain-containing membrane protein
MLADICVYDNAYFHSQTKQTPWSESACELYRPSDRHLSAKLVPNFADRGCHVVSVTDPYGRILGFLDQSHYFSTK